MTTDFEDQAVDDATPKVRMQLQKHIEILHLLVIDLLSDENNYLDGKTDTPTCEESEPTNHLTTDFDDEAALDTTQKVRMSMPFGCFLSYMLKHIEI